MLIGLWALATVDSLTGAIEEVVAVWPSKPTVEAIHSSFSVTDLLLESDKYIGIMHRLANSRKAYEINDKHYALGCIAPGKLAVKGGKVWL